LVVIEDRRNGALPQTDLLSRRYKRNSLLGFWVDDQVGMTTAVNRRDAGHMFSKLLSLLSISTDSLGNAVMTHIFAHKVGHK